MPQIRVQERAGDDPPPLPQLGDVRASGTEAVKRRESQRAAGEWQDAGKLVCQEEDQYRDAAEHHRRSRLPTAPNTEPTHGPEHYELCRCGRMQPAVASRPSLYVTFYIHM